MEITPSFYKPNVHGFDVTFKACGHERKRGVAFRRRQRNGGDASGSLCAVFINLSFGIDPDCLT